MSCQTKTKIGIMGGTFNPIHCGHIEIAKAALSQFELDKVWFMPNKIPAYKAIEDIVSEKHRVEMIKLAIKDYDGFELSTYELEREGTTYTFDTLLRLKKTHKDCEFYFIMGADSLFTFRQWKNPDIISKNCVILVANRDNSENEKIVAQINELKGIFNAKIYKLDCEEISVSSNEIRNSIKNNLKVSSMIPANVLEYIKKNNLYMA